MPSTIARTKSALRSRSCAPKTSASTLVSIRTATAREALLNTQPTAPRRDPAEPRPESGTLRSRTCGPIATTRTCPVSKRPSRL
eukprot:2925267-Pleurochrysis_carterae.AAC.1